MLKFVSSYLALSYLAFAALAVAGLLQILAAWRGLAGFALLDYRRRPRWRQACGPALIVLAYAWFFGTRREILTPGPAGAELTILFGGATLLAVALTLLGASIRRPYRWRPAQAQLPQGVEERDVLLEGGLGGRLLARAGQGEAEPGICLLPDPALPAARHYSLAGELARQGWTVLVPDWRRGDLGVAEALALVKAGLTFLGGQPLVDPGQLALVGSGLGGDLALRAAAEEPGVRAVVALAPLLEEGNARDGLGMLREMTYVEAVRWGLGGRRRAVLCDADSAASLSHLGPRPALVLYGSQDAFVSLPEIRARLAGAGPSVEVRAVPGEGHLSLASSAGASATVAEWLADRLGAGLAGARPLGAEAGERLAPRAGPAPSAADEIDPRGV